MAIQADHLHLVPHQLIQSRREIINNMQGFQDTQMGFSVPLAGGNVSAALFTPPLDHNLITVDGPSEGGITYNNFNVFSNSLPRKRSRDSEEFSIQQTYELEIDHLIRQHVENVRAELAVRRWRLARLLMAAVEHAVDRRLKAREEEIQKIKTLNFALEERVKGLLVENQTWRELATAKEAEADELQLNIQRVIIESKGIEENPVAEEAESCCDNQANSDRSAVNASASSSIGTRICRQCGCGEPSVLLLPCRHLCVCFTCGSHVSFCPVCSCSKRGTINVNMV